MKLPTTKIKTSIFIVLIVSSIMSIGIGVYQYLSVSQLIKERIFSEINFTAKSKAEVVETYVSGFENEAQIIADVLEIELTKTPSNLLEINNLLLSVALRTPEMAHIDLFSPEGIVIASSDLSKIGGDKTQKATYIEGKKGLFFNDLHLPSGGNKPAFGISMPVEDSNDKLLGVVLVDVYGDKLFDILGEAYLVNKNMFLISPSKYLSDAFLKKEITTENAKNCSTHDHNEHTLNSFSLLSIYTGLSGKPVLGSHVFIPNRNWCLVIEVDKNDFLTIPLRRLMILSGVVILSSFFMFAFITSIIHKIIVKPIQLLHSAMENVSDGKFDQKIDITSSNEIGDLARIFNSMIAKLSNYYNDLENSVKQKTKDLVAEIETRKQAQFKLSTTIEELEKVNKLMTGRELKMVELKKEIEELKSKGGDKK